MALLAAEHGIRGTAEAGEKISDEIDSGTGVPIYSLYTADDRGPTPGMLKDVDVLVYDLQEVGGRTWTSMRSAGSIRAISPGPRRSTG